MEKVSPHKKRDSCGNAGGKRTEYRSPKSMKDCPRDKCISNSGQSQKSSRKSTKHNIKKSVQNKIFLRFVLQGHFPEKSLLPEEKIRRVKREEGKKEKSKAFYFSCRVPFLKYVERNSTEKICIRTCTIRLAVYSLPGDPTREKK